MKQSDLNQLNSVIDTLQHIIASEQQAMANYAREFQTDSTAEPFVQQLRKRRLQLKSAGIHPDFDASTISRIETGKLNPQLQTLERLAAAYGCHIQLVPNN